MRVLIADDEQLARKRLHRLLLAMEGVTIQGEVTDGQATLERIRQGDVDVVLLDIHMPGLSGVEAMQLWPPDGPAIIFTTAHAEHAVAAFDGGAADYVLKPIEAGRLQRAIDRVRQRQRQAVDTPSRLPLATRKGVVLLDPAAILCARIDGSTGSTVIVETDRGPFFTDQPLCELLTRLGGDFRRVHRRAIVNMGRVTRFEDNDAGGYIAHTDGGQRVHISRASARRLRAEWGL